MNQRRFFRAEVIAPLAVVAVALVQFAPVLAGRVYRFEDIAAYFEPLWTAAARQMRAGRLPIWDHGAWSGQPLAGDPQLGLFYPPNWLWLVFPALRAYAVGVLAHSMWGGLGMYALARARGRSPSASAAAGIAIAASGFVVLQTRHIMFVEATAWIPWLAWAAWRAIERGRAADFALTAAATGMLLLTGGVSMIYYGAWCLAAILLPPLWRQAREAPRQALALLVAGALGLALAMPSLLPAAVHGALSPRGLGADHEFAASVSWIGVYLFPSLFIPNLLGQDVLGTYFGGGTQWEIAGYYAGMATFALAMYALFAGARERRAERIALGAIFLLAILLAPGLHSPVHRLAWRLLPLYGTMRCPPRALYVFTLGIPLLAADGLDLAAARFASRPMLRRSILVAVPALIALDLLWFQRAENPSSTLAEAHAKTFPEVAAFLTEHPGDRYINDVHLPHALHNSGLLWGAENASGYSSLPLWRYLHLLWIANHGKPYPHARLHDDLAAQGIWRFDSPVVDALDIRWVLGKEEPPAAGFVRRETRQGITIWENPEVFGRAWLVGAARVVDGEAAAAQAVAGPDFDPRREAILEEAPVPAPSSADVRSIDHLGWSGPRQLDVTVTLGAPALLVISEPRHPDWRATVDGAPAKLLAADYALMAVALPAGRHEVSLRITAPTVTRGLVIGGVAALLIALWGLSSLVRRRN